jgi:nucleoid-associated protein YgaU
MSLAKARIRILDADAIDAARGLKEEMEVQYNPTSLKLSKGAQLAEIGIYGLDSPVLQYVRGQVETLSVELFFDTTEFGMGDDARDVRELCDPFYELVKRQPRIHAPPRVLFVWGEQKSFKGVVERVERTFDLFAPNGRPVRATLGVSLKEYLTIEEQLGEKKPGSADLTRQVRVRPGDNLPLIAKEMYGDARLWRFIAEANANTVRDPLRPPPGAILRVPPFEIAGAPTGGG